MPNTEPKIVVLEWINGGGLFEDGLHFEGSDSLLAQGQAMLLTMCQIFESMGCHGTTFLDHRINPQKTIPKFDCLKVDQTGMLIPMLKEQVARSDFVLIIAPETDNRLLSILMEIIEFKDKWLNPNVNLTRLATGKNELQKFLKARGVAVPEGSSMEDFSENTIRSMNLVVKPNDGCGGEDVRLLKKSRIQSFVEDAKKKSLDFRIEEFVPGTPTSIVVGRGSDQPFYFEPLMQHFASQPMGEFSHCTNNLNGEIAMRTRRLAVQTIEVLPEFSGLIGIDCVIGARDVVIEINPRITMSVEELWRSQKSELRRCLFELIEKNC